jgi:ketosteroid isomerase-like protein
MNRLKRFFGFLTCIYFLTGCNSSTNKTTEIIDFKKLVVNWDKAHNSKNVASFSNLYDNSVLFYGTQMDKNACIESKLSLFKKYPDFYEQIFGDIQTENLNDNSVKCSFIKRVTVNQETKDYPAYLIFKKESDNWKIIAESDLTTDKNLAKTNDGITTTAVQHISSESPFVTGLSSAKVYTKEQAENGSEYIYKDGRTFKIKFLFEQIDILFYSYNENNQKERIDTKFGVGYNSDGEMMVLKKNTKFLIGQYDFDGDDIDELIIALQDNDEKGDNGLTVDVFKLQNDKWNRIDNLTGQTILGEPIGEVKMNKLTIQRHLRGFYYQWTLESGKFKFTGNI